ncbi:Carbohydrate binding module (family 6) [Vibrio gazogenes DSM 21264]|uniref:Carbohydrate binding module (Family 6) n=2 Tax=Vibrio gazogenes TaxID=687 RepID=A0A1M4TSW5_VIBGA|nr:carbohydrate-binding protein [Vibrio gazogenes]USP16157.1 family 16 glycosylhydrolase [Vibrio gazogenes]SHE47589.1 Carbohydrate binding module (family 6) [Vibrio gazogenes DSM 21264] [Vibrio gazogenes DSM 21264 = NBRC 103151]SJN53021.1 Beta-glucanase precursor [Vibrio gazogenes]
MKMKLNTALSLIGCALFSQAAMSANWQLVWQDEFTNRISPDWVFEIGNGSSGWGNQELQYYQRQNATVEQGNLVITAKREDVNGFRYTSSRMKTQGLASFRYGRVEARIRLPNGSGLWPAFWMLGSDIDRVGWPRCGELDIMEHINSENQIYGTAHWEENGHASYSSPSYNLDVSQYHNYAIEWDENEIRWYVDGNMYHVMSIANNAGGTEELHNDFFLLLNMAVGGQWPGFNIDESKLPAKMYVDYVRVYRDADRPSDDPSNDFPKQIEAEDFSNMKGVGTGPSNDVGGGNSVGWIDTGDWMSYDNINIPTSGDYRIDYRVSSLNGGGRLSLDLSSGSTVLGYLDIGATGGWDKWTTLSQTVHINAGTYNFGIYAQRGGFNLNWWRISKL